MFGCARSSFEPPAAEAPDGKPFVRQPTGAGASGRHFESDPIRDLETLRTSRRVHLKSQAGTSGATSWGAPGLRFAHSGTPRPP
jgi:hypothetical protein